MVKIRWVGRLEIVGMIGRRPNKGGVESKFKIRKKRGRGEKERVPEQRLSQGHQGLED